MVKYTSKKAQQQHAESLDEALSNIDWALGQYSERVYALEARISTGKLKDRFSSMSNRELLTDSLKCRSWTKSAIQKLIGLDDGNTSIVGYQEQYKELSQQLNQLSVKIEDMPLKKASRKGTTDDEEDDEPSESDIQKEYIATLHFATKNVNKLSDQLGQLSNKIVTEFLTFSLIVDNYKLAKNKFEEGLAILQSIDPNNIMLPVYQGQLAKWDDKYKSIVKKRIIGWTIILCATAIFMTWCACQ